MAVRAVEHSGGAETEEEKEQLRLDARYGESNEGQGTQQRAKRILKWCHYYRTSTILLLLLRNIPASLLSCSEAPVILKLHCWRIEQRSR